MYTQMLTQRLRADVINENNYIDIEPNDDQGTL